MFPFIEKISIKNEKIDSFFVRFKMIPSVLIAVEFDPDLYIKNIIYIEIPKKTFEDDIQLIFGVAKEKAADFFLTMYQEAKMEKKCKRPMYKALRGLVRNVWFNPHEKTFDKAPNENSPIYKFFSDDLFYLMSLPTQMLPETVRELYEELLEKEKPGEVKQEAKN